MSNFLVKFWNRESGWLHSTAVVDTDHSEPAEIAKAGVAAALEKTGEDMSTYRASVHDPVTGEGIPEPVKEK